MDKRNRVTNTEETGEIETQIDRRDRRNRDTDRQKKQDKQRHR